MCCIRELNEILRLSHRDIHNNTPLHIAAQLGNISVVKYLLSTVQYAHLIDTVNSLNQSAVYKATHYEHIDIVVYLLQCGATLNYKYMSTFVYPYQRRIQQKHSYCSRTNQSPNTIKQLNQATNTLSLDAALPTQRAVHTLHAIHSRLNNLHATTCTHIVDDTDSLDILAKIPHLVHVNRQIRHETVVKELHVHFMTDIAAIIAKYEQLT